MRTLRDKAVPRRLHPHSVRSAGILVLSLVTAVGSAQELDPSCVTAISGQFPAWRLAPVSEEVREWVASTSADPVLVSGDFDGDGVQDSAALIQNRQDGVLEYPLRAEVTKIVLCLGRDRRVKLLTIERPYCSDYIAPLEKGTEVQDIDTDLILVLPADGLSAVCFEKAGAVYFVDKGQVREIVNSD